MATLGVLFAPSLPDRHPRAEEADMQRDESAVDTPTVDDLVSAWRAGAVTRREFLRRAGVPGPDPPEARAGRRAGRRHLEVRPALLDVCERHPGLLQRLRQPHEPPSR